MMLAVLVIVSAWFLSFKKEAYLCMYAGSALGSVATMYATTNNMGIDEFELGRCPSSRQYIQRDAKSFFMYVNSRSHQGGGLAGGK